MKKMISILGLSLPLTGCLGSGATLAPYAYQPSAYDQAIAQHHQNNQAIVEMYQKRNWDYWMAQQGHRAQ